MFQSLHTEYAKASAPRTHEVGTHHRSERGRGSPPTRARVRRRAAGALASLARHLDAESARRVVA